MFSAVIKLAAVVLVVDVKTMTLYTDISPFQQIKKVQIAMQVM
jgi:hypothetical protein